MLQQGFIQIYTGDGKGKTTAALGLTLRALGHGWKVLIVQFTKGEIPNYYGEIISSAKLAPYLEVKQFGLDRVVYSNNVNPADCKEARRGWELVKKAIASEKYQLIVMDEINICIDMGMIKLSEVKKVLENRPDSLELVLTGRRAHPELVAMAHLVTEMKPVKHYFDVGIFARQGIEY